MAFDVNTTRNLTNLTSNELLNVQKFYANSTNFDPIQAGYHKGMAIGSAELEMIKASNPRMFMNQPKNMNNMFIKSSNHDMIKNAGARIIMNVNSHDIRRREADTHNNELDLAKAVDKTFDMNLTNIDLVRFAKKSKEIDLSKMNLTEQDKEDAARLLGLFTIVKFK